MTGEQSRLLRVGDRVCWGNGLGTTLNTKFTDINSSLK
jgi:hypothetical protein